MVNRFHIFSIAAMLAVAGQAQAQDVQNFKPAVGTWNYFTVEGAQTSNHLLFVPSLYVSYANKPLVQRDGEKVIGKFVEHLTTFDIMGTFGLFDRLELGVAVPLNLVYGDARLNDGDGGGFAMGDIRLTPKLRLFGLSPDDKNRGFGMAISMPITLPTGDPDRHVSNGSQPTFNPKLIMEGRFAGIQLSGNVGARIRPDHNRNVPNLELGNEITYGAGFGVELGHRNYLALAEVYGAAPLSDLSSSASSAHPLEGNLGVRIFTDLGLVMNAGVGTGIIDDYGAPHYRVFGALAWHKRLFDTDNDGIWDHEDQCPENPEDKDGFEDLDGCPDLDNDADGIPDVDDQCPNDPEDKDGFKDEDGCPDPDNDGDQICDPWVTEQNQLAKYAAVCHSTDQCPNQAEDVDGFEDGDGCPDPDNDKDGLCDPWVSEQGLSPDYASICKAIDRCPDHPEDFDNFEDEDGCPDPDNDRDGILDVNDKCPDEAEIFNGIDDEDGCPDGRVKLTAEKIEIMDKVYFETNKAIIRPVSYDILNQVAMVLRSAPHIKKIRIEGHTDSDGNDDRNMKLSQARAESVMQYLITNGGVEPERLEPRGYGETMPIDSNKTKAGKANNRRVEFVITDQGD